MNAKRLFLLALPLMLSAVAEKRSLASPGTIEAVYILEKANQQTAAQLDAFEKFMRNYFRKTANYDPETQSKDVTKVRAIFAVEPDGNTMKIVEVHIEGVDLNVIYGYEDFIQLGDGVIEVFRTNIENIEPRYDGLDLIIRREDSGYINIGESAARVEGAMQYEFERARKQYLFDEVVKKLAGEVNGAFEFKTAKNFEKLTATVLSDGEKYTLANLIVSYKGRYEKTSSDTLPSAEVYRVLSSDEGQRFPRQLWNDYIRNEALYAWDEFIAPERWRIVFHLGKRDLVDFTLTGVSLEFSLPDSVRAKKTMLTENHTNGAADNSKAANGNHIGFITRGSGDSTLYVLPVPLDEEFYDVFLNIEAVCNYYRFQMEQSRFDIVESVEVRMEYEHDVPTQSNTLKEIYVTANYKPVAGRVEQVHPAKRQWTNEEVVNEFKKGVTTSLWSRLFNDMEPNIWTIKDFGISKEHQQENLLLASFSGIRTNFAFANKPMSINLEIGQENINYPFVYGGGVGYHVIINELDSTPLLGWIASSVDLTYRAYGPLEYFMVRRMEELYSLSGANFDSAGGTPKRLILKNSELTITKRIHRFKNLGVIDLSLGIQGGGEAGVVPSLKEVPDGPYLAIKSRTQFGLQIHFARGIKYITRSRFYMKNFGIDFAAAKESSPQSFVVDAIYRPGDYSGQSFFFAHITLANFRPHPKYGSMADNFIVKFRVGLKDGLDSFMIDNLTRLSPRVDLEIKVIFYNDFAYKTGFLIGPVFKLNF
jgi:DNA-directed RNA polymerase subunit F